MEVKEGDRNMKYFHLVAKRRRKTLSKLWIRRELEDNQERNDAHVEEHHNELYKETGSWRTRLDGVKMSKIMVEERVSLEEKAIEEETLQAIKSLAVD